jgi:hypothetical protein
MIVLLAAGIGVCILGLLAIGFGIPISDTSFGNALLIAGVVVLCTGIVLLGMWLVVRELSNLTKLVLGQATQPARATAPQRPAPPLAPAPAPALAHPATEAPASASPPPWADEAAARGKPQASAVEARPAEPELPPPPPPAPDRPARRNLLFASKRRDKEDQPAAALPSTALETEPKVSFENAWPSGPTRSNGAAERQEPQVAPASEPAAAEPAKPELPPGVTVMKSGVVDGMAYTLYSDGSIEAQLPQGTLRFGSISALRSHIENTP